MDMDDALVPLEDALPQLFSHLSRFHAGVRGLRRGQPSRVWGSSLELSNDCDSSGFRWIEVRRPILWWWLRVSKSRFIYQTNA